MLGASLIVVIPRVLLYCSTILPSLVDADVVVAISININSTKRRPTKALKAASGAARTNEAANTETRRIHRKASTPVAV